jgi:hypothetical protein
MEPEQGCLGISKNEDYRNASFPKKTNKIMGIVQEIISHIK